jgi:hypothetical protein
MTNTSADFPGYLTPTSGAPLDDQALDVVLQAAIIGMLGIQSSLVRPRWQVDPPKEPEPNIDWCAVGVTDEEPDANVAIVHDGAANGGLGQDTGQRSERITAIATFFGPNARTNAKLLRDGLYVQQNRAMLNLQGLAVIDTGGPIGTAELINTTWRRRADLTLRFNRLVVRTWNVENIVSAPATIDLENSHNQSFTVPQGS